MFLRPHHHCRIMNVNEMGRWIKIEARNLVRRLLVAIALTIALATPAWANDQNRPAGGFNAEQTRDIEQIVRDNLLSHPEIIVEAIQRLQGRGQQAEE